VPVCHHLGHRTIEAIEAGPVGRRMVEAWVANQVPQCGYGRDRRAGTQHLRHQRQLLLQRPATPPLHHADHLGRSSTVRHRPSPYA